MITKSYARTSLKQFIRGKPIRFGLKFWGLCSANGYLFDLDLYCGKGSQVDKLNKCALGTKVVMHLLHKFFKDTPSSNISKYHLYHDNYITSVDLMLHLKKLRLKSTETIRDNRVSAKNIIDNEASRGTFVSKYDENSRINYMSVMDSKQVSIASSATGVTRMLSSKRYSAEDHSRIPIPFPNAFYVYNRFMDGVDLHDSHCNNVQTCIRDKKWTRVVLIRLIQASNTNTLVIYNLSNNVESKKIGTENIDMSIARHYLYIGQKRYNKKQEFCHKTSQRKRFTRECIIRTHIYCYTCDLYYCTACRDKSHANLKKEKRKKLKKKHKKELTDSYRPSSRGLSWKRSHETANGRKQPIFFRKTIFCCRQ